jgi:hypothetical protein
MLEGCGRKPLWPILKYPGIFKEELRKTNNKPQLGFELPASQT